MEEQQFNLIYENLCIIVGQLDHITEIISPLTSNKQDDFNHPNLSGEGTIPEHKIRVSTSLDRQAVESLTPIEADYLTCPECSQKIIPPENWNGHCLLCNADMIGDLGA